MFGKYSKYYDLIYEDKDYKAECDFIESLFAKHSKKPVQSILDAGCGTGGHMILLAQRGYKVTGIDSSGDMVLLARQKAPELEFKNYDLRFFTLPKLFDACVSMFNTIGYITEDSDLLRVFNNIRFQTRRESIFTFDVWNGAAIEKLGMEERTLIRSGLRRIAIPEMDKSTHICKVHYTLHTIFGSFQTTHKVRYFFPEELASLLEARGFEVLEVCPFMNTGKPLTDDDWCMTIVAEAVI